MVTSALAFLALAQIESPTATSERLAADLSRALQARDLSWCDGHLAPGFVYTGLKGDRQDRDWMLGRLRSWFHPLGYHVEASLARVSSRAVANGLLIVGDIVVRSQLFGFRRMPLTVTTERVESRWRRRAGDWTMDQLREVSVKKTVDGKPVSD